MPKLAAFLLVLALVAWAAVPGQSYGAEIQLGEANGEIAGPPLQFTLGGAGGTPGYSAVHEVTLKAGKKYQVTATVKGPKDRVVAIVLFDHTGAQVADSGRPDGKTAKLPVEAPSSNKYKLHIYSRTVGAYDFKIVLLDDEPDEARALEKKIEQLEKELKEAREKLRKLKPTSEYLRSSTIRKNP